MITQLDYSTKEDTVAREQITSLVCTMGDLLDNYYLYEIPRFQRGYSWTDENIDDFIVDVNNIDPHKYDDYHFIGSIIYHENVYRDQRERDAYLERYSVVDGQQRITTTIILLCALRDVAFKLKNATLDVDKDANVYEIKKLENDVINVIDGRLFRRARRDTSYTYLKLDYDNDRADDRRVMMALLNGPEHDVHAWEGEHQKSMNLRKARSKDSVYNIRSAYRKFYQYIDSCLGDQKTLGNKVQYLKDFIIKIDSLRYIDIKLDDIHSAYNIFMTLNDRGTSLTNADLIKSHVTRMLADTHASSFNSVWTQVIDVLKGSSNNLNKSGADEQWVSNSKSINEDKFFIAYAKVFGFDGSQGVSKKNIAPRNIFRYYEAHLCEMGAVNKFKNSLAQEAEIYRMVSDPNFFYQSSLQLGTRKSNDWKKRIVGPLHALNLMGITQHTIFAYILLRLCIVPLDDEKPALSMTEVSEMLAVLENFHFQYNGLFGYRTNAVTDIYDDAVKDIISVIHSDSQENSNSRGFKIKSIRDALFNMKKNLEAVLDRNEIDEEKFVKKFKSLKYVPTKRKASSGKESNQDYAKIRRFEAMGKGNTFIQYILSKYQPTMLGLVDDFITIEHIYPQSKGGDEVHLIGNLMLLPRSVNEKVDNLDIVDKIDALRGVARDKEFIEIPEDWSSNLDSNEKRKEAFAERADKMARVGFKNIWSISKN